MMDHIIIIARECEREMGKKRNQKKRKKITKLVNITMSPRAPFSRIIK